jgi:glutathione S-transferase
MKPVLWQIPYSPWSERARWALEAASIDHERKSYQPILGELSLRRLRNDGKPASVPVLVVDDAVIADSADIARWAASDGPLRPDGDDRAFDELFERGLAAGRVLGLRRVLADRDALLEMVPPWLRMIPPLAAAISAMGVRRTLAKYRSADPDEARRTLRSALEILRERLAAAPDGEPRTLCGRFTTADIAMSQVLAFVRPPDKGLRVGPANRRCFHDPELAAEYPDLLAWRDALYARYR